MIFAENDNGLAQTRCHPLVSLFHLAAAVDDKGNFLPVFHRLHGNTFGGGLDVPDFANNPRIQAWL